MVMPVTREFNMATEPAIVPTSSEDKVVAYDLGG
jgi:hypothetical protein